MADETWDPRQPVKRAVDAGLADADFFWALRFLQMRRPGVVRVGESTQLRDDWFRLCQTPHYFHTASPFESVTCGENDQPDELRVRFFGLFGPNGGLPLHLTEMAADRRLHAKDETLWRFIDLFHHRMLSFFFRAWAVHQPTVDLDRPDKARYPVRIGALLGLGQQALTGRDHWGDFGKLYHAGHLVRPVRNASGLESILRDFFEVPVRILTFVGHWVDLPASSRCALGASEATGALGRTTYVGERIWDCQTKFRVQLGPLRLDDFKRFFPDGTAGRRLRDIVRFYAGFELAWDLQCLLLAAEVPAAQLGGGARLGWTSWLKTQVSPRDSDDLVLDLEACAA